MTKQQVCRHLARQLKAMALQLPSPEALALARMYVDAATPPTDVAVHSHVMLDALAARGGEDVDAWAQRVARTMVYGPQVVPDEQRAVEEG